MPKVGDIVRVFVSGRHDFTRQARVVDVDSQDKMIFVAWVGYDLSPEWIPVQWL